MTRTRVDIRVRYPRAEYRFPRDRSRCFAAHDGMDREEDNEQEEKKEGNGGKKQERERERVVGSKFVVNVKKEWKGRSVRTTTT